jgi:hypothetical protein
MRHHHRRAKRPGTLLDSFRESGLQGPQRNPKRIGGWKEVFLESSGLRALGHREFPDALVELLRDLQVCGSGTAYDLQAQQAGGQNDAVASGLVSKVRQIQRQFHHFPSDNPDQDNQILAGRGSSSE